MTGGDYVHGQMEVDSQKATYSGFIAMSVWVGTLIALAVLFLSLVFAAGQPWLGSLFGVAFLGVIAGIVLRLGGAWYATVVGLTLVSLVAGGIATLVANVI
jgi:hypothetical protein